MKYETGKDWRDCAAKRVILFGMSGLGKTHVSQMMRATGEWYHYSVDYRIGTRYLGEAIDDNLKRVAMREPFLREQLMTDSIFIKSNITFSNLAPVSYYLGKPGARDKGGLALEEYRRRQAQFRHAEEQALLDTGTFIDRASHLYGYPHFVCDTGGSFCEWVDPENPEDPILQALSKDALLVWIKGSPSHTAELIRRFDRAPKPMAYQPEFLSQTWSQYLNDMNVDAEAVDPDAFIRYAYSRALAHRQPRYEAIAGNWGVTVTAEDVATATTPEAFVDLIGAALDIRGAST
ncbi:ATPase [Celeribacter arenosi]|uniref:ATPase n=1 Tax=Celeribacter arenosi TaxID=792649 RepID=A0ABP7KGZ7_9RHOB